MARSVTVKWKPTTEQRTILESIYRSGIRTPKAEEIERITVDLKRYGKVEGKNVFYWFQNFNARERNQRKSFTAEERQQPKRATELLNPKNGRASGNAELSTAKLTRSTSPSEIVDPVEGEQEAGVEQDSGICCNNSQACPTLELFPLRPDRGGFEQ